MHPAPVPWDAKDPEVLQRPPASAVIVHKKMSSRDRARSARGCWGEPRRAPLIVRTAQPLPASAELRYSGPQWTVPSA